MFLVVQAFCRCPKNPLAPSKFSIVLPRSNDDKHCKDESESLSHRPRCLRCRPGRPNRRGGFARNRGPRPRSPGPTGAPWRCGCRRTKWRRRRSADSDSGKISSQERAAGWNQTAFGVRVGHGFHAAGSGRGGAQGYRDPGEAERPEMPGLAFGANQSGSCRSAGSRCTSRDRAMLLRSPIRNAEPGNAALPFPQGSGGRSSSRNLFLFTVLPDRGLQRTVDAFPAAGVLCRSARPGF